MARGKKSPSKNFTPVEFVRCELSSDDRKQVPEFVKRHKNNPDDLVTEVLQNDIKISFSYSEHNDSFICSFTGRAEAAINANSCFTSHGKTYTTALWVGLYKHFELFKAGVWESPTDDEDFG